MASQEEVRAVRLEKLRKLAEHGMEAYPAESFRTDTIQSAIEDFDEYVTRKDPIIIAGRVMSLRPQGALVFLNIFDGTGKFQVLLKKGDIAEADFNFFSEVVDIGDFVEFTGTLFLTNRNEKTLQAGKWRMLTKSLLPLPEKWHGLQDPDEKFRKRYLDILMDEDVRTMIEKKAAFWDFTRTYLKNQGFLEVETPTLELTTGGAEANPFKTHHRDYDLDVYLRISVGELWQKRLLAAGLPRTFEIGRVYRNEGTSPEHAQEFTNLEFYAGYMDYEEGMAFTEKMIRELVVHVLGKETFTCRGFDIDISKEWKQIDYVETVEQMTGLNVLRAPEADMEKKLSELGVEYEGKNRERLVDTLWKYCRKQIAGPVWLINHPKLVSPLSKAKSDNPELTERVQLVMAGAELTNGFSELNNPIDQKERFDAQQKLIAGGDTEAMMPDHEFVEMLEYGMPPAFGFSYGDRLFAFLVDRPLRETQIFPLMRPHQAGAKKDKERKIAVAVLNSDASLEGWQKMNTVGHLTAAFGARAGRDLFMYDTIQTADRQKINLNIQHAIMIKEGAGSDELQELAVTAKKAGLEVAEFTREMLETTNDKKIAEITKGKKSADIEYLGVLVFGPKSKTEELTQDFSLAK